MATISTGKKLAIAALVIAGVTAYMAYLARLRAGNTI